MPEIKRISDLDLTLKPLTVPENSSVSKLLEHFTSEPTMRDIYTINEKNELVGIIDRKKIFSIVFADYLDAPARISELYHIISATTARDLSNTNVAVVHIDDSLSAIIELMLKKDLFEIPVLDRNNCPVATLTLWDLLKAEKI